MIQNCAAYRLFLPCRHPAQQRPQPWSRCRRIIERVHEGVIALGTEYEQTLVQQDVDRLPASAINHELGARLAKDRRRMSHHSRRQRRNFCDSVLKLNRSH